MNNEEEIYQCSVFQFRRLQRLYSLWWVPAKGKKIIHREKVREIKFEITTVKDLKNGTEAVYTPKKGETPNRLTERCVMF